MIWATWSNAGIAKISRGSLILATLIAIVPPGATPTFEPDLPRLSTHEYEGSTAPPRSDREVSHESPPDQSEETKPGVVADMGIARRHSLSEITDRRQVQQDHVLQQMRSARRTLATSLERAASVAVERIAPDRGDVRRIGPALDAYDLSAVPHPTAKSLTGGQLPVRLASSDQCADAALVWTGASQNNSWSDVGNWLPQRLPGSTDDVCIPAGATPKISSQTSVRDLSIQTTAVVEFAVAQPYQVRVFRALTNEGTIRVTGAAGFRLECSASVVNRGLIQIAATGASPSVATFDTYTNCSPPVTLYNAPTGVVESWSTTSAMFSSMSVENDGWVVARAGQLSWAAGQGVPASPVQDGVSAGRFSGEGGTLTIGGTQVGPATVFGNGVELSNVSGTGSVPEGVTVTVVGILSAQLSGPGWVSAQNGARLIGNIVGNMRIGPLLTGGDIYITSTTPYDNFPVTITPGAVVEFAVAQPYQVRVFRALTNEGTIRVTGAAGFRLECSASVVNRGLIQIAATGASPSVATFDTYTNCSPPVTLYNAPTGVVESWSTTSAMFSSMSVENDGWVVARAGQLSWAAGQGVPASPVQDGVSAGRFSGEGGTLTIGGTQVGPATVFGNGVELSNVSGTGSVPEGVTVTVVGILSAQLSGPGWVSAQNGARLIGNIVGNMRIGPLLTGGDIYITSTTPYDNFPVTITPGAVVEFAVAQPYQVRVFRALTNEGTIRVTGAAGFRLECSASVVNRGLIQIAATGASPSVATFDTYTNCSPPVTLYNAPTGVVESWSTTSAMFSSMSVENDGWVVARAGQLSWAAGQGVPASPVQDGVSAGRFSGEGGTLTIGGTQVGPATVFGNGVELSNVSGTGSVPEGVTVTVVGILSAQLSGPGWVSAQNGARLIGNIVGNMRIGPLLTGGDIYITSTTPYDNFPVTITPGAVVEFAVAQPYQVRVFRALTNEGTIRVTGAAGFRLECSASVVNRGLIQIAATGASPSVATFDTYTNCSPPVTLYNAPTGVVESLSPVSPSISVRFENDGSVIASNGRWLLTQPDAGVIHSGSFSSTGQGHLVLCGLFLLSEPGSVADNVGLADRCGTMVADVTDFTAATDPGHQRCPHRGHGPERTGRRTGWSVCNVPGCRSRLNCTATTQTFVRYTPAGMGCRRRSSSTFRVAARLRRGAWTSAMPSSAWTWPVESSRTSRADSRGPLRGRARRCRCDRSSRARSAYCHRAFLRGFDNACNSFDGSTHRSCWQTARRSR